MYGGTYSLVDSCNVSRSVCLANALFKAMSSNPDRATATLFLQVRSHFEPYSTKNHMVMELLNRCHCSVYSCSYIDFLTPYISVSDNTTCHNCFEQVITSDYVLQDRFGLSIEVPRVQYGIRIFCEWESAHSHWFSGGTYSEGGHFKKFVFHHDGNMPVEVSTRASFYHVTVN